VGKFGEFVCWRFVERNNERRFNAHQVPSAQRAPPRRDLHRLGQVGKRAGMERRNWMCGGADFSELDSIELTEVSRADV
jgi:hypothetical protein